MMGIRVFGDGEGWPADDAMTTQLDNKIDRNIIRHFSPPLFLYLYDRAAAS